jgi:peptide chain release factor subunit 1
LLYFLGVIFDESGKEKDICIDLIPPYPIKRNDYKCDKIFHVDLVEDLYQTYDEHGIILVEGDSALFYKYSKNECKEIDSVEIYRKNKNRRGGQSSGRFFRIRLQQIDKYIKTLNEMVTKNYIDKDMNCCTIKKLIIAGTGDIKDQLVSNKEFPQILKNITTLMSISSLDINLVLSNEIFNSSISNTDCKEITEFYDSLSRCINNVVYGKKETMYCLENGYIKHFIIHKDMYQEIDDIEHHIKELNCNIVITEDKTFKSYGGIGAILWFPLDSNIFSMIE